MDNTGNLTAQVSLLHCFRITTSQQKEKIPRGFLLIASIFLKITSIFLKIATVFFENAET